MRALARLLWVVVTMSLATPVALACDCAPQREDIELAVLEEYQQSTAVVVAAAEQVANGKQIPSGDRDPWTQVVNWRVDESFKGPHLAGTILMTSSSTDGAACGFGSVKEGDVMVLYLHRKEPYAMFLCSRTGELKYKLQELGILRRLAAKLAPKD